LRRLAEVAGSDLVVVRSLRAWRASELRLGSEPVAILRMHGLVRWSCVAESAAGRWRFEEAGFGTRAVRLDASVETPVAEMRRRATDPHATIEAGRGRYTWAPSTWQQRSWSLRDDAGSEIAYFRRRVPAYMERMGVGVPLAGRTLPDLDMLVLMGCYLALTSPVLQRETLWPGDEYPPP
jgi:hypothetical protein